MSLRNYYPKASSDIRRQLYVLDRGQDLIPKVLLAHGHLATIRGRAYLDRVSLRVQFPMALDLVDEVIKAL
jgi:hypothetical protein